MCIINSKEELLSVVYCYVLQTERPHPPHDPDKPNMAAEFPRTHIIDSSQWTSDSVFSDTTTHVTYDYVNDIDALNKCPWPSIGTSILEENDSVLVASNRENYVM